MTRSLLEAPQPLGPARFAAVRMALGIYLATHFAMLIPCAGELYGPAGMIGDPELNVSAYYLPSTPGIFASETTAKFFLATLTGLSVLFSAGRMRRAAAFVLWVGLILLLHRNNLTSNVSLSYVGWLLLATLIVPLGEGGAGARRDPTWKAPPALLVGAWALFGLTYSYSGWMKLQSAEWTSGSALSWISAQPLAIATTANLVSGLPDWALRCATWAALGAEILCAPLVLLAPTRALAWSAVTLMQVGLLGFLHLHDVTIAVLIFHLLLFDPSWIPRGVLSRLSGASTE